MNEPVKLDTLHEALDLYTSWLSEHARIARDTADRVRKRHTMAGRNRRRQYLTYAHIYQMALNNCGETVAELLRHCTPEYQAKHQADLDDIPF